MEASLLTSAAISTALLAGWVWLVLARGQFWRTDQRLPSQDLEGKEGFQWPAVSAVIPGRNEAEVVQQTIPTLLNQDYPGPLHFYLVDDGSKDGTSEAARRAASDFNSADRLTVVKSEPPPRITLPLGAVWLNGRGFGKS